MAPHQRRRLARRLGDCTGSSLIEASIVTPLLLFLTFGIIDFGWMFYANLALESGVSQAVRYAVTGRAMDGLSREASIKAVMRSAAPALTIEDDDIQFSHLTGGRWVAGVGGPGEVEKVTVTYSHRILVLTPFFRHPAVDLQVESAMKNEERFE
jgi:Flp pilus assembly protein TadG